MLAVRQPADEFTVDLDTVEAEALQVRQRGIAGAEVIEQQWQTGGLETAEGLLHMFVGLQQRAFGDLQLQHVGRRTLFGEDRQQAARQIGLAEVQRRQVDRDA